MTSFPMLPDLPDGIYFGLPEEIYHALPRIGSGGITDLLISPATFWKGSWLNPKAAEERAARAIRALPELGDDPAPELVAYADALKTIFRGAPPPEPEEATKAQLLGKAYHCARLEPHKLESRFRRALDRADFADLAKAKGACWNGTQIGEALAAAGQAKKKGDETVVDQGRRLAATGYEGVIWPLEEARFKEALGTRVAIPADLWDDMLEDADRLRQSPEVARLLAGGEAEVAVLYTGPGGIRRKAKFDVLKLDSWADLKTFANPVGKNLRQLLSETFRYGRHYIQAIDYRVAVEMLRANALPIVGEATDDQRKLIAQLAIRPDELACWYVYQEKGGVPNILARRVRFFDVPQSVQTQNTMVEAAGFSDAEGIARVEEATRTRTLFHVRGAGEIDKALRDFAFHSEIYRPGRPWLTIDATGEFTDDDFPAFWLDERI
jgi:hypothetical protein